ncbi:hypothetical protein [Paenibacillus caui]|uniref:hypothetical protein n=1 Tax=Paenibacillus caui TaxID=2873927 RepID=UPI001CAA1612|nr:hypothetical protein [Paenibacillus caui]
MRKFVRYIACLPLFAMLFTGCQNNKTPQEWFDLTWTGLAGADAFHIQGEAEIIQSGQSKAAHTFHYTANLDNHTELTIKTVPPFEVQGGGLNAAASKTVSGNTAKFHLEDGGRWVVLQDKKAVYPWSPSSSAVSRINPLAAIEELRSMQKSIREEHGAARGTRILRIKPDSEQERLRLKNALEEEMFRLQSAWKMYTKGKVADSVKAEGDELLARSRRQMTGMLDTAKVNTVYHLTIDKRNNLPMRMTSETQITYRDGKGTLQRESLWNDAKFTGYR